MLANIGQLNPKNCRVIIYDARSWINALANRMNKGGFENKTYYTNCEIVFCEIDNIHGVRDSINKLYDMAQQPALLSSTSKWLIQLDNTGWLQIISKILSSVNNIVDALKVKRQNVLVHCSDGWDRTTQFCTLAQMLLDPYFRTIRGFEILVEKDWLSFGHMFHRRLGHYNKNYKDD